MFCYKQNTAYEMRISDWSSDVCSSDLMSRHSAQLTLTMPANKTRAVLPRGSWHEPEIYAALADFGVRGLAWELLRRNPDYPGCELIGDLPQIAGAAFTARWGLHFRRSAVPARV